MLAIILLSLFSCTNKKTPSHPLEKFPFELSNEFRIIHSKSVHLYTQKEKFLFQHKKDAYFLDYNRVEKWLTNLKSIPLSENTKGVAIAGITPTVIKFRSGKKTLSLNGFQTNKEFSLIQYTLIDNLKKVDEKAFYVSTSDFKKVFSPINALRINEIKVPGKLKTISYLWKGQTYQLPVAKNAEFLDALSTFKVESFPYSGVVDEFVLKKNLIGVKVNNNVVGTFILNLENNKKLKIHFSKPIPYKPKGRIWIEGQNQVIEGSFPGFPRIKKLQESLTGAGV